MLRRSTARTGELGDRGAVNQTDRLRPAHHARRHDAVVLQLLPARVADPVGRPGGRPLHRDLNLAEGGQRGAHIVLDQLGGRAAGIGGRQHHLQAAGGLTQIAHDAQLAQR